jgi:esterase/lipase superfamily enzyme
MNSFKRPLLIGAGIIAAILLVLAAYAYFIGTRTLLDQAEAFAFRRMTVSQLADQGSFRFFYATNRSTADAGEDIERRFDSTRQAALSFGSFDTDIQASLGLGMIIDPSDWFLNEEIQLQQLRPLPQKDFLLELREQVEKSPRRSLLLVVHGFREAFPSALRKTAFLAHVLDINTPVMVFDWPGDQGSSLRGYRRARQVAEASGAELAATMRLIIDEVQPDRLWLLANSMGGQVVVDAFGVLSGDAGFADAATEIENVVLTAPDVDHKDFNQRFKRQSHSLAKNVTIYVSSNDRALLVSRLINRGLRLGESTLDPAKLGQLDQLEQAASFSELLEAGSTELVLVDVTPVNRTRNFHNFSLETPEFFDDLYLRFTGNALPATRELYPLITPGGGNYYVLTRGR